MKGDMKPTIGELIAAWRHRLDITVRAAAVILEVSPATVSRIERGKPMDAETQLKLILCLFGKTRT
jgi:transcriptional regulator with XRE-family HTH domain